MKERYDSVLESGYCRSFEGYPNQDSSSNNNVVELTYKGPIPNPTTSIEMGGETGTLALKTLSALATFFQSRNHRPSEAMWEAVADIATHLEMAAHGRLPPLFYLSSLDPGVGKTQTVVEFIKAFRSDPASSDVGAIICVSRLDEIERLRSSIGLSKTECAVVTADDDTNRLGVVAPDKAQILFTTQQMIESRCKDRRFAEVEVFHFRSRARAVRIWDEGILPGQTLTIRADDIASLLKPMRPMAPELTSALERLFDKVKTADDGACIQLPDFSAEHGVDVNRALALMDDAPDDLKRTVSNLWFISGRTITVRRDGIYGNTILDYRETLPSDLAPLVILDASGRVRSTYRNWAEYRGNLVHLRSADKRYDNLTVHVWEHAGGKRAFFNVESARELADGIAATINGKPDEEWLVVFHKPQAGFDLEAAVRALAEADTNRLHFLEWGRHQATNDYTHVSNVILAGTLFYRPSQYESLSRLAAGWPSGKPHPKEIIDEVVLGEHRHLVLQALCRGSVRRCEDDVCSPCDAYIIASVRSGIAEALPSIFPGCGLKRWQPTAKTLTGKVADAVRYIEDWFDRNPDGYLPFTEVRRAIGAMSSQNFRSNIRRHHDFQYALAQAGIVEHAPGKYPRGFVKRDVFKIASDPQDDFLDAA